MQIGDIKNSVLCRRHQKDMQIANCRKVFRRRVKSQIPVSLGSLVIPRDSRIVLDIVKVKCRPNPSFRLRTSTTASENAK